MTILESPSALYRFYDREDRLLYVGITGNLPSRQQQHEGSQPWWQEVARMTVEHFPTREDARAAEQAAIDAEAPLHNSIRSVGKTPLRSFRIPDDVYRAAQEKAAERGESVSDVVRKALERYVKRK